MAFKKRKAGLLAKITKNAVTISDKAKFVIDEINKDKKELEAHEKTNAERVSSKLGKASRLAKELEKNPELKETVDNDLRAQLGKQADKRQTTLKLILGVLCENVRGTAWRYHNLISYLEGVPFLRSEQWAEKITELGGLMAALVEADKSTEEKSESEDKPAGPAAAKVTEKRARETAEVDSSGVGEQSDDQLEAAAVVSPTVSEAMNRQPPDYYISAAIWRVRENRPPKIVTIIGGKPMSDAMYEVIDKNHPAWIGLDPAKLTFKPFGLDGEA